MGILNKIPPHSIEAEQAILASVLLDPEFSKQFCLSLDPEKFYKIQHREIFTTMLELLAKDIIVDLVSLNEKCKGSGYIEYVVNILEDRPSAQNLEHYIKIVEEKYNLRLILQKNEEIANKAWLSHITVDEYLTEQKELADKLVLKNQAFSLSQAIYKTIEAIEKGELRGLPIGFPKFDKYIGGLIPGDLIVVGARPSMGKTAFIVCVISTLLQTKKRALFFSLEMSTEKIINRTLSIRTGIPLWKLKSGHKLDKTEWHKLSSAGVALSGQDFLIDDRSALTALEMRKVAYSYHLKKPVDVIFIDYLQRMKHKAHKSGNRAYEVGESVIDLKSLARDLNIPVVLLSQFSRDINNRTHPEPRLSDLRESGDIEQEADLVIFPWRPSELGIEGKEDELIIAKHRDGAKKNILVNWWPETAEFRERV